MQSEAARFAYDSAKENSSLLKENPLAIIINLNLIHITPFKPVTGREIDFYP